MIKINSKNFTKRASSIADALYNDCITLIKKLKTKKFNIISVPLPAGGSQQWTCLAEQAKEAGKDELLQKLKNTLTEAIGYSDKNPGITRVNLGQLSSASELLPLIQSLGSK